MPYDDQEWICDPLVQFPRRRRRWPWVVVGWVCLALAVFGVLMALKSPPPADTRPENPKTYHRVELVEVVVFLSHDGEDGYWTEKRGDE